LTAAALGYPLNTATEEGRTMTAPIEDVSSLLGTELTDQDDRPIGKIGEIYAINGDGRHPMWVTVEASVDEGERRTVFIPLARLKREEDFLCVPYSLQHVLDSPEVSGEGEISSECEELLRAYYGIRPGEEELSTDNHSYVTLVPDEEGTSHRVENTDEVETPDPDRRTEETQARRDDPGPREIRKVTAKDVIEEQKEQKKRQEEKDEGAEDAEES
jgi:hypothetical protein